MKCLLPAIAIIALCTPARPQAIITRSHGRLAVYVNHTGEDAIGTAYAQEIRRVLQQSVKYQLVDYPVGAIIVDVATYDLREYNAQGKPLSLAATLVTVQTNCPPGVLVINHYAALVTDARTASLAADLIKDIENEPRFRTIAATQ